LNALIGLLWALHLISCVLLTIIVLLQSGRGAGVAGLFGGAAGESPFGSKTGTLLGKITGGIATFFVVSAVLIAIFSGGHAVAMEEVSDETPAELPQAEGTAPEAAPAPEVAPAPEEGTQPADTQPAEPNNDAGGTGYAPVPLDTWLI